MSDKDAKKQYFKSLREYEKQRINIEKMEKEVIEKEIVRAVGNKPIKIKSESNYFLY